MEKRAILENQYTPIEFLNYLKRCSQKVLEVDDRFSMKWIKRKDINLLFDLKNDTEKVPYVCWSGGAVFRSQESLWFQKSWDNHFLQFREFCEKINKDDQYSTIGEQACLIIRAYIEPRLVYSSDFKLNAESQYPCDWRIVKDFENKGLISFEHFEYYHKCINDVKNMSLKNLMKQRKKNIDISFWPGFKFLNKTSLVNYFKIRNY